MSVHLKVIETLDGDFLLQQGVNLCWGGVKNFKKQILAGSSEIPWVMGFQQNLQNRSDFHILNKEREREKKKYPKFPVGVCG